MKQGGRGRLKFYPVPPIRRSEAKETPGRERRQEQQMTIRCLELAAYAASTTSARMPDILPLEKGEPVPWQSMIFP
jgi:hypothetical protein